MGLGDGMRFLAVWAIVGMGLTGLLLLGGAIWLVVFLIQHLRFA